MKKRGGSAVRWVCAWAVSGAIAAQAATGVWSNVSGGYWADGANWQDSVVPSSAGSEPGSGDVADFTALAAGETVTVTNYTGSGALRFAGLAGDFWTVTGGSLGLANAPDFLAERYGEIRVDGGELNLVAPVNNGGYGVAKTGTGIQIFVMVSVVLGIASILAITVMQKSRQIGILKAMGIKNSSASLIFLFEGLILGIFGAVTGILLGVGLSASFTAFALNPDGTPVVDLYISGSFIAISGVIAVLSCVIASLIPARRSSKLSPIDIIRNN